MSDWLYRLLNLIMSSIVTSLLSSPLTMTNKYIQSIATVPGALFLACILSLGIQIAFNLMDAFGTPLKQESKETREPQINSAGLYLYVICFFLILFDQILMLKVDIILNMHSSFKLISDYSDYLTNNSLIILKEIKRNLEIVKKDNDKLSCISLPNNIDDAVTSLMLRINNVITASNNFQSYIDTAFQNADKYNSDPGSVFVAVAFFYIIPIAFGAAYVYCHHNRKLKLARLSVHFGCLWFIIIILGACAWFFVTIFISKLCSDPQQGFAALVAYLASSGKDIVTSDNLKVDADYYTSCKGQGSFDKSIISLTSATTTLYDSITDYSNSCSIDSSTTADMKLHLQLLLHYYKTWSELLNCANIKKVYYDEFIEIDVCQNMFVGTGTFWFSQVLSSIFTLLAIVALSYACKLYDSDRFDADGNLIKPKKKRRRIKWYDVRDVMELRKKAAEQARLRTETEENDEAEETEEDKGKDDKIEKGEGEGEDEKRKDIETESDDGASETRSPQETSETISITPDLQPPETPKPQTPQTPKPQTPQTPKTTYSTFRSWKSSVAPEEPQSIVNSDELI